MGNRSKHNGNGRAETFSDAQKIRELFKHIGATRIDFLIDTAVCAYQMDGEDGPEIRSERQVEVWLIQPSGPTVAYIDPDAADALADELRHHASLARAGLVGVSKGTLETA